MPDEKKPADASGSSKSWRCVLCDWIGRRHVVAISVLVAAPPWAIAMLASWWLRVGLQPWPSGSEALLVAVALPVALLLLWLLHAYERAFLRIVQCRVKDAECHVKVAERPEQLERFGSFLRNQKPYSPKDLFEALSKVRDHLQDSLDEEIKNVALRVTWMLAGQALLLGPLATIATSANVDESTRKAILGAICLAAAMVSLVLSLGAMLGHAYIEDLRTLRDTAEERLAEEFDVPATGVAKGSRIHGLGHSPSRFLPLFFYCMWVCGLPFALHFKAAPVPPGPHPGQITAWSYAGRAPAFPRGEAVYPAEGSTRTLTRCPTADEAKAWVRNVFVPMWTDARRDPQPSDVVMLIGGADAAAATGKPREESDPNLGLARQRADEVLRLVRAATADLGPATRISDARAIVLVSGPASKRGPRATVRRGECGDQDEDRTVQVWYATRASATSPP